MASTPTNLASPSPQQPSPATSSLLVCLSSLSLDQLESTLSNLALAFPSQSAIVAAPGLPADYSPNSTFNTLRILPYTPPTSTTTEWVLTASDYINAFRLAQENNASNVLLLGAEPQSIQPAALRSLASAATGSDLVLGHYNLGSREGLFNSAILYPVTRALFSARPRFPLAIDLGLSPRMAERLSTAAQRFNPGEQADALLWPLAEATAANFSVAESDLGIRALPHPAAADLNLLLSQIAGSLFSDVDAKAAFWQRVRNTQPSRPYPLPPAPAEAPPDIAPMLNAFQLAYTNLHEIWSLVLPPNTLLGIKRLSLLPPASFSMPDSLWARIVYDFILAYRLRTINRGHLLGALTPLYLAWVASHLLLVHNGTQPEKHVQDLAAVFENDKPYFVSRWRWPDRFNP